MFTLDDYTVMTTWNESAHRAALETLATGLDAWLARPHLDAPTRLHMADITENFAERHRKPAALWFYMTGYLMQEAESREPGMIGHRTALAAVVADAVAVGSFVKGLD